MISTFLNNSFKQTIKFSDKGEHAKSKRFSRTCLPDPAVPKQQVPAPGTFVTVILPEAITAMDFLAARVMKVLPACSRQSQMGQFKLFHCWSELTTAHFVRTQYNTTNCSAGKSVWVITLAAHSKTGIWGQTPLMWCQHCIWKTASTQNARIRCSSFFHPKGKIVNKINCEAHLVQSCALCVMCHLHVVQSTF